MDFPWDVLFPKSPGFSSFPDFPVKLMDFSWDVLFPESPGFSSFPGFRVKLMDFPRDVLFQEESPGFSSFPVFPVKLTELTVSYTAYLRQAFQKENSMENGMIKSCRVRAKSTGFL